MASIYEGWLFVCFVCQVETSQTMAPLVMLLVPLEYLLLSTGTLS
jgi:hypothetical protein